MKVAGFGLVRRVVAHHHHDQQPGHEDRDRGDDEQDHVIERSGCRGPVRSRPAESPSPRRPVGRCVSSVSCARAAPAVANGGRKADQRGQSHGHIPFPSRLFEPPFGSRPALRRNPVVSAPPETILDAWPTSKTIAAKRRRATNYQGPPMTDAPFRPFETHLDEATALRILREATSRRRGWRAVSGAQPVRGHRSGRRPDQDRQL